MTIPSKKPAPFTLTIDWEDFGQLYYKYFFGEVSVPLPKTIDRQTDNILELLNETRVTGTFFILGILAKYRPDLVKKIAVEGHEIALHGMNHEVMFKLSPVRAKADISESQKLVSDITGTSVLGYRAPFFSIIRENIYVLNILAELGFQYDSSIFPTKTLRYGITEFNCNDMLYKLPNGGELVELPLTTIEYAKINWPISGGGYIRLIPFSLLKIIFNSLKERNSMIYMHPYEFDTEKLDVTESFESDRQYSKFKTSVLNFRWNLFRPSVYKKIKYILTNNSFSTCLEKASYVKNNSYSPTILG